MTEKVSHSDSLLQDLSCPAQPFRSFTSLALLPRQFKLSNAVAQTYQEYHIAPPSLENGAESDVKPAR